MASASPLGNASQKYSPMLTVEHRGYVNGTVALDYLAEDYPDATEVVLVGKTAGSVAAPVGEGARREHPLHRCPQPGQDAVAVLLHHGGGGSGLWPDHVVDRLGPDHLAWPPGIQDA
jgi:hypothetical protein